MKRAAIPKNKRSADEIVERMESALKKDVDWRGGRVFSLVYHAGEEHEALLKRVHGMYSSANLLNPMAFEGLKGLEAEVVQMAAGLFNGPPSATGSVTSGGTESILVAMHAYRERARKQKWWIRRPEIVLPRTAHPAFDKAANYFGIRLRKAEVDSDMRAKPSSMARLIGRNTIGLVASAPQYPHGVIDPIDEIGKLAQKKGLPLHVDACIGGYILPWLEKIGRPIPAWDFRVPGVTSISADLHKYAYASKGASTLMWRSMESMRYQFFIATDFPGGIYASPTMLGTRPGGPVAAAWAALNSLGEEGYCELAKASAQAADEMRDGIRAIPELELVGDAHATIVAWRVSKGGPDTFAVAEQLEALGWSIDRQQHPACIHLTCTANHLAITDRYLADLRTAIETVKKNPALQDSGTAPMYGMMAKLPVRGLVSSTVRGVLESMYAPGQVLPPDISSAGDGFVGDLIDKYGAEINHFLTKVDDLRQRFGSWR